MSTKQNCWEFKECGYGPGGRNAEKKICPAAINKEYDGVNGGRAAGRFCWMIENTTCNEISLPDFKFIKCTECEFYQLVEREENRSLVLTKWDVNKDHLKVNFG